MATGKHIKQLYRTAVRGTQTQARYDEVPSEDLDSTPTGTCNYDNMEKY